MAVSSPKSVEGGNGLRPRESPSSLVSVRSSDQTTVRLGSPSELNAGVHGR